jgi:hypothetical protein
MTQPSPSPSPMVVRRPHPSGMAGVRISAQEVADRIARDMRDEAIMKWSRRTIAEANLPGPRGRPDPDAIVAALFAAIKKIVAFVKDPLGTELMVSARHLLCLDAYCVRAGDCDDQLIVLGACTMSVGIPVRLRIRRYAGQDQAHVTMLYDSNPRLGGPWRCIDPSTDSGACSNAPYAEEFTIDVNPGAGELMFIGVGEPPWEDDGRGGDLGQGEETLPADQADAWAEQVQIAQASLQASAANLRALYAASQSVRSDLGLPAFDTLPAGENAPPGGLSNLNYFGVSGLWTQAAANDQAKLLSAADFAASCLGDALAGARTLNWDQGDVFVGSLPGDPYRILMQTPPGGAGPVPTVLDAQGQVQGTLGFIQFIVGAAAAAVISLAAAYAVGKLCDYLSQKHHDEALNQISDNQTKLVASGQMTPAQAAAQTQAMTSLASASKLPTSSPLASSISWGGLAVAGVVGGALGFALDRMLRWFAGRPARAA